MSGEAQSESCGYREERHTANKQEDWCQPGWGLQCVVWGLQNERVSATKTRPKLDAGGRLHQWRFAGIQPPLGYKSVCVPANTAT